MHVRKLIHPPTKPHYELFIKLHVFWMFRDTETVEELVEKKGLSILSARDKWGYTPAHWAALDGNVEVSSEKSN